MNQATQLMETLRVNSATLDRYGYGGGVTRRGGVWVLTVSRTDRDGELHTAHFEDVLEFEIWLAAIEGGGLANWAVPRVMGILNITPDSFSDGGRFLAPDDALVQAERMIAEGADILDVGGESTRPGAAAVSLDEEMARVLPLIERVAAEFDIPVSVDTSKPELMRAAVAAGAAMINDVSALRLPGAVAAVAALDVPVCLMHMQGEPRTMQTAPQYPTKYVARKVQC